MENSKKQFVMNNLEWELYFVEHDHPRLENTDQEIHLGITYKSEQTIYIDRTVSSQQIYKTVVHELIHAFLFSYGFDNCEWDEESMCNFIGQNAENIIKLANEVIR